MAGTAPLAASPGRQNLHLATLFPASLGGTDSLQYGYFNGFHWTFEVLEYSGSSARGLGRRSRSTSEINLTSRSVAPMESRIPVASFWRRVFQLLDLERIVSLIHSKHFFNRLLTLLLDYDDTPTLADSDARRIVFARRSTPLSGEDHGTWKKRTVLSSSEDLYMGTAILELDWLGYPVIAFWQRSEEHPNGLVRLASSRPREPKPFHRGDANDDGRSDMGDALRILDFLFLGGERPGCLEAADTANMGSLNLNAPIFLLNYLFKGGQALPPPGPASEPCGSIRTRSARAATSAATPTSLAANPEFSSSFVARRRSSRCGKEVGSARPEACQRHAEDRVGATDAVPSERYDDAAED